MQTLPLVLRIWQGKRETWSSSLGMDTVPGQRNRAANISETGYDAKQEGQCKRRNGWVGDGDKVGLVIG